MAAVNILLVDDNPADRMLVQEALQAVGYTGELKHASTLAETLILLDALGTQPWPRLLIVDGHLPDGLGADLIARVQQRPAAAGTIMVMLTGDGRRPAGLEGIDWYEKPDSWKGWQAWAEAIVMRGGTAPAP
jgi:CheY-like chemotaxis protein